MKDRTDSQGRTKALKPGLGHAATSMEATIVRRSRCWRFLTLLRRGEQGQSLVETALVLSFVVLPLTTGILVFGVAMNNYLQLTNAVSIGARTLSLNAGLTTNPCAVAASAIEAAAPNLTPANLTFSFTFNGFNYGSASCGSASTSTGAALNLASGTTATVTATYPLNLSIFGKVFSASNAVLKATSTELVQ
jgi:hypothetical protein